MIEATKKQLVQFYVEKFVNPEGEHPTTSEIDNNFKKDQLVDYIVKNNLESEFEKFIAN